MTSPTGLLDPSPRGTMRVQGKQNLLFPLGPVIKCLHGLILLLKCELGNRDGVVVRVLASHQCGPGSSPGLGALVEFVVGSRLCSERFRALRFSPLFKKI